MCTVFCRLQSVIILRTGEVVSVTHVTLQACAIVGLQMQIKNVGGAGYLQTKNEWEVALKNKL